MKRFWIFLKTELKRSLRDMNMPIFAVIMPLVIFIILGVIYGGKPAYDGADYTCCRGGRGGCRRRALRQEKAEEQIRYNL